MSSLIFDAIWRDRGVSSGLKGLGKDADLASARMSKLKTAAAVGLAAAGVAVLKFGKDSVVAYAEAETAQAKLAFAFRKFPKLADTNQASLQKLNATMQLKTKYDDDAIASGQAVLAQYDLTGKQLASVTPLLLDYAAKTGKDLPAAAAAMGKAFLGNTRALKEIGVNYKSTGDRARDFANITDLMRQQVGGFAEAEGKTAAGQLAILRNQFGELQEAAGAKLMPALTSVIGGLTKGVEVVGKYGNVIGPAVVGVGGLATALWAAHKAQSAWAVSQALTAPLAAKAVGGLNALKVAFTGVELTAKASGRAMRIAQLSIPVVGVALFAATTAMAAWASKSDDGASATADFASAMQTVEGNVTRATAALNENVRAQAVNALQSKGAFEQARALGLSYGDVTDAALGNAGAITRVNAALGPALALNRAQSKANADTQSTAAALAAALGLVAKDSGRAAEAERIRRLAMDSGAGSAAAAAAAADEHAQQVREEADALNSMADEAIAASDALLQLSGSQIGMESAIDAASKAAKDNGKTLDINTAKGRANRQALDALAGATIQYTNGLVKSGASATKVAAANERGRASFIKTARAMGVQKGEAIKMADALFAIPKEVKSQVVLAGGKVSKQEAKDLNKALKGIPKEQRARIVTIANTKGAKAAREEIKKVKDKQAKIKFETNAKKEAEKANRESNKAKDRQRRIDLSSNARKVTTQSNRDTDKARGKKTRIDVSSDAAPVSRAAQRSINGVRGKSVSINVSQSGVGTVQRAISSITGRTIRIKVVKDAATGGPIGSRQPGLADGGRVRVGTTSTADDVVGIDRRSGVQTSFVSFGEFVTNARQYQANRSQVETINAGGKWDLVPRRAAGGPASWQRFERMGARGGAGVTQTLHVTVNAPNYVGSQQDLVRALESLDKRGALRTVRQSAFGRT